MTRGGYGFAEPGMGSAHGAIERRSCMPVETGLMDFGQAFLAEGAAHGWNLGGFTVGQFNALDVQVTSDTGDDWVSQMILDSFIGMQSPATSTSGDGQELSYQVVIQNTGADGYYQIMWLTVT